MCEVPRRSLRHYNLRLGKLPKAQKKSASDALAILREMQQVVVRTDEISLNSAISACGAVWWQSLQLLWDMPQLELRRDVRSFAMPKSMPWATSVQLLLTMEKVQIPPNQITFSAILPAQHWHCALDLCMASRQSDIVMDRVTFEAIIRSCGQHWPRSHALLMSMRVQIVSANRMTYNSILNSLKSHWELALRILEAMPSLEVQPDTVSYSLAATEWRWANALIQAMPSRSLRVDALGLRQAAMSGPWRPALELLQSLPEDSQVALSASYASVLLWQQALAVSESQVLGFNLLLKSMDGAQWQSASHILLQMASSQVQANMVTYNTFLSTLSWQQALVWLQRLSIDQTINFDLVTFGTIIRSCADGQQWRWALHFLHCMGTARLQCSLVLCNAALSACAWHRSLWLLKDLWNQQLVPDVVSINTVLNSFSLDSSAATGL